MTQITIDRAVVEQLVGALEDVFEQYKNHVGFMNMAKVRAALTAGRAALAQPQGKAECWYVSDKGGACVKCGRTHSQPIELDTPAPDKYVDCGEARPLPAQDVNAELAYNKVDRFLRNNLGDDDYAEYSEALDTLANAKAAQQEDLIARHGAKPAQDVNAELVEALEAAQRWHNGDKWRDTDKHEEWAAQAEMISTSLANAKAAQLKGQK